MSDVDIRNTWLEFQDHVSTRANANKQSQDALQALFTRYRSLSEKERTVVDALLADQLGSHDEGARFDALALIREFRIVSAVEALRALASWLETQNTPGAPYEWAKVNRLLGFFAVCRAHE